MACKFDSGLRLINRWFVLDAIIIVWSIAAPQSEIVQSIEGIEGGVNLVAGIFAVYLAFRAKRILLEHLAVIGRHDVTMNGVATFFFGVFYIQYKINRLIAR